MTVRVSALPTRLKQGSQLSFAPFDLCPYQHYGRVAPFTKPLCYQWEQKAAPKVQQSPSTAQPETRPPSIIKRCKQLKRGEG